MTHRLPRFHQRTCAPSSRSLCCLSSALQPVLARSAIKLRNRASFDLALREKFNGRGLRFFGLFLAIPFRYFDLVFGVTTSVKVPDNGALYGGQYRRWRIVVTETAQKRAQPTLPPKIAPQVKMTPPEGWTSCFFFRDHRFTKRRISKTITATAALACLFENHAKAQADLTIAIDGRPNTVLMPCLDCFFNGLDCFFNGPVWTNFANFRQNFQGQALG